MRQGLGDVSMSPCSMLLTHRPRNRYAGTLHPGAHTGTDLHVQSAGTTRLPSPSVVPKAARQVQVPLGGQVGVQEHEAPLLAGPMLGHGVPQEGVSAVHLGHPAHLQQALSKVTWHGRLRLPEVHPKHVLPDLESRLGADQAQGLGGSERHTHTQADRQLMWAAILPGGDVLTPVGGLGMTPHVSIAQNHNAGLPSDMQRGMQRTPCAFRQLHKGRPAWSPMCRAAGSAARPAPCRPHSGAPGTRPAPPHLPNLAHRADRRGHHAVGAAGGGQGVGEGLLVPLADEAGEQLVVQVALHVEEGGQHQRLPRPAPAQ